jgi:hypothetical protein
VKRWVMLDGQALAQWHLIEEAQLSARAREPLLTECGLRLGWERSRLREMTHRSVVGNRCAACVGQPLR